jgi:hypothetical protein
MMALAPDHANGADAIAKVMQAHLDVRRGSWTVISSVVL